MQAVTDTATDIYNEGGVSPLKHVYSQLLPPTTQGLRGDNLLGQFWEAYLDAIKERGLVLDV